jgi:LytTr DNA-binding domain
VSGVARLSAGDRATALAWERFATGESEAVGVRPAILESWLRCRDELSVEPGRDRALPADPGPVLAPVESVVAAELGAAAMQLLPSASALGGVVVVADGHGRLLSAWGHESSAARGSDQNLGPLYSWAEPSVGTTGVATALATGGAATVTRFEHWCSAFQDWSCAAAAVTDLERRPLGVIGVSLWRRPLPDSVAERLAVIARDIAGRLAPRLRDRGALPALAAGQAASGPKRLVGLRGDRSVIVSVASVRLITVEDGLVWLATDEGRLRAAGRSLDQLERALAGSGFVRVSRTALVNVEHVRELAPAFKGAVWISVDGVRGSIAVSRRRVGALRAALGI